MLLSPLGSGQCSPPSASCVEPGINQDSVFRQVRKDLDLSESSSSESNSEESSEREDSTEQGSKEEQDENVGNHSSDCSVESEAISGSAPLPGGCIRF